MELRHYLTCLWPGMPELWWLGQLSALPVAVGFGAALNLLLITRYIYPEWISSTLVSMAFWISVCVWGFYVFHRMRDLPGMLHPRAASDEPDQFTEARDAYLRGQYHEAERLMLQVLSIQPRDPPALLLLCGIYRHTERLANADRLIKETMRLEVSDGWWLEIDAERRRIEREMAAQQENTSEEESQEPPAELTAA